jgi:hypothetical protein
MLAMRLAIETELRSSSTGSSGSSSSSSLVSARRRRGSARDFETGLRYKEISILTDPLLEDLHQIDVSLRDKRNRGSLATSTSCPSYTVHVVVRHPRYFPIDHHCHFGDIESTRSNIGSDEKRDSLSAEGGEGLEALGLRKVGVEGGAGDGVGEIGEEVGEKSGGTAVRDEEDRLREDRSGVFLVRRALGALVGLSTLVLRLFGCGRWVEREGVGEGAEVEEEVDEVDLADLRGNEDVFLCQAGGSGDAIDAREWVEFDFKASM